MSMKDILKKIKKGGLIDYAATQGIREREIKKYITDKKGIIYGAKALNAQVPFPLKRATQDYDVFVKDSKKAARELDRILDKRRSGNFHYVKKGEHKGTWKVKDIGGDLIKDTEDDFTLVDFSTLQKIKTVKIGRNRFSTLREIEKSKLKALSDSRFKFRHAKDKMDVQIIRAVKKKTKRRKL